MAKFVPKAKLIEQLRRINADAETGLLTILTESNRSVFLRFSNGDLTRLHCRSGETDEALQTLAESSTVGFTYASAPGDDQAELMPVDEFIRLIDPDATAG